MAEDTRDPATTGETGGEKTSGAALIATFYGRRGSERVRGLRQRLDEHFGAQTVLCFDPDGPGAHDATVLQLGLNAPGDAAADAWQGLRGKVEGVLDAGDLEGRKPDGIWGYTLVYQAVVGEGHEAEAVLKEALPSAGRLHCAEESTPIKTFEVAGGLASLAGIPEPVGGPDAGMVYVVLGPREGERDLLQQFYSISERSTATLLAPDLMAHKGYYQMRQYRTEEMESNYAERLKELKRTTDDLLGELRNGRRDADGLDELFRLLDKLFRRYSRLLPVASSLKELRVGVLEQSENLELWRYQNQDNEALELHQGHLRVAVRELESKVEPLQSELEVADKAVSAARLQLDKEQEQRRQEEENEDQREKQRQEDLRLEEDKEENRYQQFIQVLLAVVATALALPEIIDKDVAGRVIGLLPVLEPLEGNIIAELVAQVVLVVMLAIPIVWAVRRWLARRRKEYRAQSLEEAITRYERALEVYTRDDFPVQWAGTQHHLANAYRDRIRGEKAENLEEAISHYEQALEVYTREDFPVQWATTRNDLAASYSQRAGEQRSHVPEGK